jgi:hypothetical protein
MNKQEIIDESANPNINWIKLREKFFQECTMYQSTGIQTTLKKINLAPHDLFEWFKRNIQRQSI